MVTKTFSLKSMGLSMEKTLTQMATLLQEPDV